MLPVRTKSQPSTSQRNQKRISQNNWVPLVPAQTGLFSPSLGLVLPSLLLRLDDFLIFFAFEAFGLGGRFDVLV